MAIAIAQRAPSLLLVGTSGGGLYGSADRGAHWQEYGVGLPLGSVRSLIIADGDRRVILTGMDVGLFLKASGHWTRITSGVGRCNVFLAVAGARSGSILYAASWGVGGGVFRSGDLGRTWNQVAAYPTIVTIVADPAVPDGVYIGGVGGIMRTTDGGKTWTTVAG
jgi:photosystem II stability/assembly factor-like uncharacterized protein